MQHDCQHQLQPRETNVHGSRGSRIASRGAHSLHSAFATRHSALPKAFTLTELLIVIILLVLLLAMAMPAFNYITGARSVENTRNMVSAMLARTRVAAVNSGKYVGVLFYVDPATMRTTMTTVRWEDPSLSPDDIDPVERYKAWGVTGPSFTPSYDGQSQVLPTNPPSVEPHPDRAIRMTHDDTPANGAYAGEGGKPLSFIYRRVSLTPPATPFALAGNGQGPKDRIVSPGNETTVPAAGVGNEGWEILREGTVDIAATDADLAGSAETQVLPPGVGVQVAVDPEGSTTANRYMRTGLILFDPNGRIDVRPFGIREKSALGISIGMTAGMTGNPPRTGLGLAFYDLETFTGAGYSEGDPNSPFALAHLGTAGDETAEETWIDETASVSLINRASGTLIGGQ